jgi:predicted transcriptional regulator
MDLVAQSPNTCDDCLSNETEIKPRQRIRYYLRRLMEEGIVERIEAGCTTCGREKIVTFILDMLGAED